MNKNEIIYKLRILIAENRIEDALSQIHEYTQNNKMTPKATNDELIVIKREYYDLKSELVKNILSSQEYALRMNRLASNLLGVVNSLERIGDEMVYQNYKPVEKPRKVSISFSAIIWSGVFVLLIGLSIVVIEITGLHALKTHNSIFTPLEIGLLLIILGALFLAYMSARIPPNVEIYTEKKSSKATIFSYLINPKLHFAIIFSALSLFLIKRFLL
ncbi:hypothetical protein [Haliscomenobacter hydrossis]|uniref:Effector-associated domain-containing protein n=1 Tax=Haliscomenobacter hydrossis (strain ATCC 27775 / DSM 1100 / LMG 10767 / O) TaxID=760192 RepID=F4KT58_HALH1|nr:hypothetical protein [Haliscomenobacter hydrossis]AEE50128.1 hypothetical protein Halhy_2247 [Haliscomenobacter hydrossis DSM 1100]